MICYLIMVIAFVIRENELTDILDAFEPKHGKTLHHNVFFYWINLQGEPVVSKSVGSSEDFIGDNLIIFKYKELLIYFNSV